ncbi:hypothetical protein YPPY03_1360, partial [Yersinia pestis PY-03]|jgi:hypothetical protein
MRSG